MFAASFDLTRPNRTLIAAAPAGHDARVLADVARRSRGEPVVFIALDDARAAAMEEALGFFAPDVERLEYPAWDCLPYDRVSPQAALVARRLATLDRLTRPVAGPAVVITTLAAATQRILPPEVLQESALHMTRGVALPLETLRRTLATHGYTPASTVREPGEFAVRGGIVDLFPSGTDAPVRLDFFGDELERLSLFDPVSQTTTGPLESLHLDAVSEVLLNPQTIAAFRGGYRDLFGAVTARDPLYESVSEGRRFPGVEHWLPLFYPRLVTLFDYRAAAPVVLDHQLDEALDARLGQIDDFYQARYGLWQAAQRGNRKTREEDQAAAYKPVPSERLYLDKAAWDATLAARSVAAFSPFQAPDTETSHTVIDAGGRRGRDFAEARAAGGEGDLYAALRAYLDAEVRAGKRVAIACYSRGSAERLSGLLRAHSMQPVAVADWDEARRTSQPYSPMVTLGLEHGFVASDVALVTEQDILGDRMVRAPKKRRASAAFRLELGTLASGDFVVHEEHGVGRFDGLETITALGAAHDCVKLIYDGGDKLFVPVENMDVLTRYGGPDCGAVLDKLGGVAWQARKARVKKRLKDMADDLLKIAAARAMREADVLAAGEGDAEEFAARFPYVETEDQAEAIRAVLADLASGRPMDRLVCGDVGFGKTEVALRAAFAAVRAGSQVAVVVPTTLLARQHTAQFTTRFKEFGVRVASLSRLVSAQDAARAKAAMAAGEVDIVVGTHALLAADVKFQNLGLMIIDEEQHFGVKQKERLKTMRAEVHVLTLTATPIPRTLQLSLAGVRELSLITTPPVDRLAVRSFVLPYDPVVIRDALMREHYRGGQSFYVCPRIEDLAGVEEELRQLVPEVRLAVAHGRMAPGQLDEIMTAFDMKQFDVLLATNIIESGLDIPAANTMVIHRADLFGLAQLYQLRGRVGRGKQRGYAYLTTVPGQSLTQAATARLETIQTLDQLGAGFQLASYDMDIRGAGNLLGEEQSGHVREVGVELYQQMLEDAVAAAKAGSGGGTEGASSAEESWAPQINLGMSVLIPETYVQDLSVRMGLYRRLAEGADDAALEALAAEMIDRFGPLPPEVDNLLQTVAIKHLCRLSGIARVDAGPKGAVLAFHRDRFARPDRLVEWIARQSGTVRVRPDQKIALVRAWHDAAQRLQGVGAVLKELAAMAV